MGSSFQSFKSHREFGKKRVHEMALFREYEYTRTSLHAQFYMASRQELKIVEFYSSGWAPELPLAMNAGREDMLSESVPSLSCQGRRLNRILSPVSDPVSCHEETMLIRNYA